MFPTGHARCAGFHFVRDRFAAPLLLSEVVAHSQNSPPLKRRSIDHGQTQHSGYSPTTWSRARIVFGLARFCTS